MDFEATRHIQPEMQTRERLMWSGRPPQGLRFRKQDIPTVLFGLAWTGVAVFWTWSVWEETAELIPTLMGGLMILIGVHQFLGRFFLESYVRSRTFYGVSDQRMVILKAGPPRSFQSLDLAELPDVSLETEGLDGGVLRFAPDVTVMVKGKGRRRRRVQRRGPHFELETGARSAYEIIKRAQYDARRHRHV